MHEKWLKSNIAVLHDKQVHAGSTNINLNAEIVMLDNNPSYSVTTEPHLLSKVVEKFA